MSQIITIAIDEETEAAEEKAEEWGELSIYAGMDAYLSYFCESRKGLLDYFDPEDTFILFDELTRCVERGKQTEVEFSESMKHRLEKGYILLRHSPTSHSSAAMPWLSR